MAYVPTNWKDKIVSNPRTYTMTENANGTVTFADAFGSITEEGTPLIAENLNNLENGIVANETYLNEVAADVALNNDTLSEGINLLNANKADLVDGKVPDSQLPEISYANPSLSNLNTDGEARLKENISNWKLVKNYHSGNNWYKIFEETQEDGTIAYWCEQGGNIVLTTQAFTRISFYIPFLTTSYSIFTAALASSDYRSSNALVYISPSKDIEYFEVHSVTAGETPGINWEAKGYCNNPEEMI